jgi:hypothetical protein
MLLPEQEPLGEPFASILAEHLWELYEKDNDKWKSTSSLDPYIMDKHRLDFLEKKAVAGQVQIAKSLSSNNSYEIAILRKGKAGTVSVYSGSLRDAIDKAMINDIL